MRDITGVVILWSLVAHLATVSRLHLFPSDDAKGAPYKILCIGSRGHTKAANAEAQSEE